MTESTPQPTGAVIHAGDSYDLVLTREFNATADDVWASLTEPERSARWFGPWTGTGVQGAVVQVQMAFEEGAPWCDLRIDVCEPPHRLSVAMLDDAGEWRLELRLAERDGVTELRFTQHLTDPGLAESAGPGWEYYLDLFAASRNAAPLPTFDAYYPALKDFYAVKATE